MEQSNNDSKKKYKINTRPIISLLIGLVFFTTILIVTLLVAGGGMRKHSTSLREKEQEDATPAASEEQENGNKLLAIVKAIDTERKQITLYDVEQEAERILYYTGGSGITDKYGKQMAMSQIQIGTMVEADYQPDENKMTDMQISTKAWEYVGVSNMNIDRSQRIMKIAATKYKYTDQILILDGTEFIPVSNLAEQDELTVRGYDQTIWSITVTRGHGTVRLTDYEAFLGASITIGYEAMQQITEDLVMTVREGNFNLSVENERFSATKNITVQRNQETVVSLSDLGPEALKQGRVTFEITPFGADLFVDNELISYADSIELSYGEHSVIVSLGGYTTYQGILTVDTAGKVIKIDLPEAASTDEVEVTESENTQDGSNNSTADPTQTDTTQDGQTQENEDLTVDPEHQIYVQSPIGASVYLNGDFKGISPCDFEKIIGTHVLTFIEEGHETMSYTVEVSNDGLDAYYSFPDLIRKTSE